MADVLDKIQISTVPDLYNREPLFRRYMQGYKYNQLSEEKLNLKIMYYENYLDFVEKLNPGFTIWRGEVLYQLHYPLLFKANKAYESGNLKKDDFMAILREIKSSLEESHQCLKLEAEGTKEAQTAQMVIS